MSSIGVSQEVLEAVRKRRGRVRVYQDLDVERMAMLVIDMENCFCAPGGAAEVPRAREIVPNINRLAEACRRLDIPVIWVVHANRDDGADWTLFFDNFLSAEKREQTIKQLTKGDWGTEIWKGLEVKEDDLIINKCRFSALIPGSSNLERILRSLNKDTLIITGTKTNICCEATARDAMMLDFKVLFISDATAALTDQEHQATLNTIIQNFGDVLTAQQLIDELGAKQPKVEIGRC